MAKVITRTWGHGDVEVKHPTSTADVAKGVNAVLSTSAFKLDLEKASRKFATRAKKAKAKGMLSPEESQEILDAALNADDPAV